MKFIGLMTITIWKIFIVLTEMLPGIMEKFWQNNKAVILIQKILILKLAGIAIDF